MRNEMFDIVHTYTKETLHLLRQRVTPAAANPRIFATLEGRSNLEMVALDVCLCVRAHVQSECICQAQARTEASKSRRRGGCENVEAKSSLQDAQWTRNTEHTRNLLARNVCDLVSCSSIISIFCSRVSRSFALHATEWRNLSSSDHLR
jgi:hypothetical protein